MTITFTQKRVMKGINAINSAEPSINASFIDDTADHYSIQMAFNFNGQATGIKILPYFLQENVYYNGVAESNYVVAGSEITVTKTSGATFDLHGVNGRKVYFAITEITLVNDAVDSVDIDVLPLYEIT